MDASEQPTPPVESPPPSQEEHQTQPEQPPHAYVSESGDAPVPPAPAQPPNSAEEVLEYLNGLPIDQQKAELGERLFKSIQEYLNLPLNLIS